MKKLFIIAFLALGFYQAQAQVTFRPGLRGGLNFSHFTKGDFDNYNGGYYDYNGNYIPYSNPEFTSKTDFYIGFYGALKLSKFYTLQPEVDYSNQGSSVKRPNSSTVKLNASYLSVAVVNKFSFNEKFNVHLGPTIDFVVDKDFNVDSDVDLAFILGAGYDINKNIGIEARVKKGLIPVYYNNYYDGSYYSSDSNHTNVVFSVGATYTFDVK